ncbi:MAG: hypothetical protein HYX79_04845 [Chloroflexi bacterium]|nr:hypothetical protein [Chloroflexota bacterium]
MGLNVPEYPGPGRKRAFLLLTAVAAAVIGILVFGTARDYVQGGGYVPDEAKCLVCHSNPDLAKNTPQGKISLYVNEVVASTSAHRFIDCTTCHTTKPHEVATPLTKLSLAQKCGSCHQYQYKLHLESIHGQQLAQGNPDVATCVDCHSRKGDSHGVIRVLEHDAPTYKKNIAETCARCHDNDELMKDYGIVEKVYESYMRSFHGKALQLSGYELGSLNKATCTNCHGVHDIKSAGDPQAPVAGADNLVKTCEQCHPGAGVEFAKGFLGHREASRDNVPQAHYTEIIFRTLMISVVAFGIFLMLIAIVRFSINRWRE